MTITSLLHLVWFRDRRVRMRVILSCMLTLLMIALSMCVPLVFKEIISRLSLVTLETASSLSIILAVYGIVWTLSHITPLLRFLVLVHVFERSVRIISLSLLEHILSLSMRFHHDRSTGSLAHSIERAQSGLETIFWGVISFLVPTCCEIILVAIVIGYLYGMVYAGLLLAATIVYVLLSIFVADKAAQARDLDNQTRAQTSARFIDSLLTIETIKYFNTQIYEREQLDTKLHEQERAAQHRSLLDIKIQIIQTFFMSLVLGIITWISGHEVLCGRMTIGDFILINSYLLQIILPLNHIGYTIQQVRKGIEDMKVVLSIFNVTPEIYESAHACAITFKKPSVLFDDVSFGYTPERLILQEISFSVEAGQRVALVGPTGSGKSTIARLLLRLYDVSRGRILIQGHDIRNLTLQSLANTIAIVPQDTHLFNHTLYYNIAYGNPKASSKDVMHAARLAQLEGFITSLPAGYDTVVGERGLKLSGGEKQRIAIARALLKKPAIFIFDEATSSLDMQTEREIQNNLTFILHNTTTIIIAHRLSTIEDANSIIVLDNGTIVQQGTHHNLLQKTGLYHTLWSQQKQTIPHIATTSRTL